MNKIQWFTRSEVAEQPAAAVNRLTVNSYHWPAAFLGVWSSGSVLLFSLPSPLSGAWTLSGFKEWWLLEQGQKGQPFFTETGETGWKGDGLNLRSGVVGQWASGVM
jgi:hypothetical protein